MSAVSNATFALLAVAGVIIFTASGLQAHAGTPAYFVFEQPAPADAVQKTNRFIFRLDDDKRIAEAREILKSGSKLHVQGTIETQKAPYNPKWSYVLSPATISFFENQIEVCDANMVHVEQHLDEVGGSYLPHSRWCPWSSQLIEEVTDIDPKTERLRP
ncbi:BP74-related protein (plasmid) [Rhizobium leguminosarum]|jgi:hypothetical protein